MHAIVVAGTHSGVGKTSVVLGLIAALRRRGLVVQPFKVGPDFIDPAHHAAAAGRPSHNLDGWMLTRDDNLELFASHAADADVAVIEGMMGLFDGADPRSDGGSAAEMAKWLGAPVVLVLDASAVARSAAAMAHGFATFDSELRVVGVVANRCGSEGHAGLIAEALEGGPPLLGWLASSGDVAMPERHLGLVLPTADAEAQIARLGDAIERNVDLDRLLALSRVAAPSPRGRRLPAVGDGRVRIGVARDEAFAFYYHDNLALLAECGAELVEFSPLRSELPSGLDGLYLGGGYPELHAAELAANKRTADAIRAMAAAGRPIYGECGGLIYLGEAIEVNGRRHPLCGVLPLRTRFPGPLQLSYAEVRVERGPLGAGLTARGHWFHKAEITENDTERCYSVCLTRSPERLQEGYGRGNALASWVHLHFRSCPGVPRGFVDACQRARERHPER